MPTPRRQPKVDDSFVAPVTATCTYFRDRRPGTDRWGTPYRQKWACGTGFGDDQYVCPLYVEESCPGCRNPGNRIKPCAMYGCDEDCDFCGGGGRTETWALCGQKRSKLLPDYLGEPPEAEFPTFRLDSWACPERDAERHAIAQAHAEGELPFAASWFPVVRHNLDDERTGTWVGGLGEVPALATGVDFAYSVMRGHKKDERGRKLTLRERLGAGPDTLVMVHGQVLDDILDVVWEERERFIPWCREQGVDVMIAPHFSCYPDLQNAMAVYNAARTMEWHLDCLEEGFAYVVFQHPGLQADWLTQECFDFVERVGCRVVAYSTQTGGGRGGFDPLRIRDHQRGAELYPPGVDWLHFGATTPLRMQLARAILVGDSDRRIMFSNVAASAGAAFFTVQPQGVSAPAGWTKGEVFRHNCEAFTDLANIVLGGEGPYERG